MSKKSSAVDHLPPPILMPKIGGEGLRTNLTEEESEFRTDTGQPTQFSLRPPTFKREYARSSVSSIPEGYSKVICVDWDGTTQNTAKKLDGQKSGILGEFNMPLIRALNEHIANGGIVAITTAGNMPGFIKDILGYNNPPRYTNNQEIKKQFEDHLATLDPDDVTQIRFFLQKAFCFCDIKKGYTNDEEENFRGDGRHWENKTDIDEVKDGHVSLIGLLQRNPGKVMVYEDDVHGQTFVEQLEKLTMQNLASDIVLPNTTFELHNKAIDGVGNYANITDLPWPIGLDRPHLPSTRTPSPRPNPTPIVAENFISKLFNLFCCRNVE